MHNRAKTLLAPIRQSEVFLEAGDVSRLKKKSRSNNLEVLIKPPLVLSLSQRHHPGQHAGHPVHGGAGRRALLRPSGKRQERREQDQPAHHVVSGE